MQIQEIPLKLVLEQRGDIHFLRGEQDNVAMEVQDLPECLPAAPEVLVHHPGLVEEQSPGRGPGAGLVQGRPGHWRGEVRGQAPEALVDQPVQGGAFVGPVGVRPHLAGVQDVQEVLAGMGSRQAPFFIRVPPGQTPYINRHPCIKEKTS